MRLRTDSWYWAGLKRAVALGNLDAGKITDPDYEATPAAEVGDVWQTQGFEPGSFGGYVLGCPATNCDQGIHIWWHAYDCPAGKSTTGQCKRGAGRTSCWDWSGDAAAGTLTAQPSLFAKADLGGCGWHGFLSAGVMKPA